MRISNIGFAVLMFFSILIGAVMGIITDSILVGAFLGGLTFYLGYR